MPKSTRREALVTIAAAPVAASAIPAAAQEAYQPRVFSETHLGMVKDLVQMIIPATETPGAGDVGVHQMIDGMLSEKANLVEPFLAGLQKLEGYGFSDLDEEKRTALLTEFMDANDDRERFFRLLKNMTIDGYYSTETGLVEELGYQGNTYLAEFPGCTHPEHQEWQ